MIEYIYKKYFFIFEFKFNIQYIRNNFFKFEFKFNI